MRAISLAVGASRAPGPAGHQSLFSRVAAIVFSASEPCSLRRVLFFRSLSSVRQPSWDIVCGDMLAPRCGQGSASRTMMGA